MSGHHGFARATEALKAAQVALDAARKAVTHALTDLETAKPPPPAPRLPPPSEHRRNHRPGRPSKIEQDPELQAFIASRIDHMTFTALAEEIAHHFPETRRVGKSTIHKWWQTYRKAQSLPQKSANSDPG